MPASEATYPGDLATAALMLFCQHHQLREVLPLRCANSLFRDTIQWRLRRVALPFHVDDYELAVTIRARISRLPSAFPAARILELYHTQPSTHLHPSDSPPTFLGPPANPPVLQHVNILNPLSAIFSSNHPPLTPVPTPTHTTHPLLPPLASALDHLTTLTTLRYTSFLPDYHPLPLSLLATLPNIDRLELLSIHDTTPYPFAPVEPPDTYPKPLLTRTDLTTLTQLRSLALLELNHQPTLSSTSLRTHHLPPSALGPLSTLTLLTSLHLTLGPATDHHLTFLTSLTHLRSLTLTGLLQLSPQSLALIATLPLLHLTLNALSRPPAHHLFYLEPLLHPNGPHHVPNHIQILPNLHYAPPADPPPNQPQEHSEWRQALSTLVGLTSMHLALFYHPKGILQHLATLPSLRRLTIRTFLESNRRVPAANMLAPFRHPSTKAVCAPTSLQALIFEDLHLAPDSLSTLAALTSLRRLVLQNTTLTHPAARTIPLLTTLTQLAHLHLSTTETKLIALDPDTTPPPAGYDPNYALPLLLTPPDISALSTLPLRHLHFDLYPPLQTSLPPTLSLLTLLTHLSTGSNLSATLNQDTLSDRKISIHPLSLPPCLEALSVIDAHLPAHEVQQLARSCPRLKHLRLITPHLQNSTLYALAACLTHLEALCLGHSPSADIPKPQVSAQAVSALGRMGGLQSLALQLPGLLVGPHWLGGLGELRMLALDCHVEGKDLEEQLTRLHCLREAALENQPMMWTSPGEGQPLRPPVCISHVELLQCPDVLRRIAAALPLCRLHGNVDSSLFRVQAGETWLTRHRPSELLDLSEDW